MPKITVTNTKGLVQAAGSGGIKVVHASVSGSAGVEGIRVAGGGASGFLHMVQGSATIEDSVAIVDITDLIPAGSTVLCGVLEVTTASVGGTSRDITSVGTINDTDCLSGTIALDYQAVGSQLLSPIALFGATDDNSDNALPVRVTLAGSVGTQTTDGVVRVSLLCVTAATTEG